MEDFILTLMIIESYCNFHFFYAALNRWPEHGIMTIPYIEFLGRGKILQLKEDKWLNKG